MKGIKIMGLIVAQIVIVVMEILTINLFSDNIFSLIFYTFWAVMLTGAILMSLVHVCREP